MPVKSPILFLIFNRPDICQRVFDKIRKNRPSRLYIAADGPRLHKAGEDILCNASRSITEHIDWDCKVQRLYHPANLGCKKAVSSAITWFFGQEEEGIILEDDCMPADDFFIFCDILLEKYRYDNRIRCITGSNLQKQQWGSASYYFSQCSNIWGWASWRRVWKAYDADLANYHEQDVKLQLQKLFTDQFVLAEWLSIFKKLKAAEIDTWDYQFHLINFFENGLCATPNVNLISNIGFRSDATHTHDPNRYSFNIPTGSLKDIQHPVYFIPEKEADQFLFRQEFFLDEKWRQFEKNKLLRRRAKNWVRGLFSKDKH